MKLFTNEEVKKRYPCFHKILGSEVIITFYGYTFNHTTKEFFEVYKNDMMGLKDICPTIWEDYREALNSRDIHNTTQELDFYRDWLKRYLGLC